MKVVKVKSLVMWSISISMLFNKSPKIKYICGKCEAYNKTRISLTMIELHRPYVKCKYCGQVNDTGLELN